MLLRRLDHVSLNATDRPRSIEWYSHVLGLELKSEPGSDDAPVFLGEKGAAIALFQAQTPAPPRDSETAGLRHVAFMVSAEDLRRFHIHLAEHGVDARYEDHGNAHSLYLDDPDGNTIELTTYEV